MGSLTSSHRPIHSKAEGVEALAGQVRDLQKIPNPWATGNEFEITVAAGGLTTIKHKLKRVPQGWIVTRLISTNDAIINERSSDDQQIQFYINAEATVKILVF